MSERKSSKGDFGRVQSLDSIRFICAVIVTIGHIGLIPRHSLDESAAGRAIGALLGVMFNGPAAVIVFFILSGLVIHYPQATGRQLTIGSFYLRRLARIMIPAGAAIFLYLLVGVEMSYPQFGVLWSVICEIVYYLLYPILNIVAVRFGWSRIVVVTGALSLLFAVSNHSVLYVNQDYPSLGLMTWVIGLPCWCLGCWLSENVERLPEVSRAQIWLTRSLVYLISVATCVLKFHIFKISNIYMLNAFAPLVALWIGLEVVYFRRRKPYLLLEWGGRWSYSLYLIHPVGGLLASYFAEGFGYAPIALMLSLVLSLIFYAVVERPSHIFAKRVGRDANVRQSTLATRTSRRA